MLLGVVLSQSIVMSTEKDRDCQAMGHPRVVVIIVWNSSVFSAEKREVGVLAHKSLYNCSTLTSQGFASSHSSEREV